MKVWQSAVFLFALIALLMALDMSGLASGISSWIVSAVIITAVGGFMVMGKRRSK